MNGPAPRGVAAVLALSLAVVSPLGARLGSQNPPPIPAAGRPIFNCENAPARIAKMTREMAVQERALKLADEELIRAQKAMNEAAGATNKTITKALDKGMKEVTKPLKKEIDQYVEARKDVLKSLAMQSAGLSSMQQRELKDLLEKAKEQNEKIGSTDDAKALAGLLTQSAKSWEELAKYLDETGLADKLASSAAKLTPAGLAISGLMIARDLVYAGMEEVFTAEEFAQAQENYYNLHGAVSRNREMLDNLVATCTPPTPPQPQQSPMPIPPSGAQPTAPPPAPAPVAPAAAPAKPKAGLGKRLGITLGVAGAVAATGGYLATHASGLTGSGSGSGSSGSPTLTSLGPFVCDATGCKGTVTINFPFTVSSGSIVVVSDPSGWMGQKTFSATSAPGNVTVELTHAYNTCYTTQTGFGIWKGTTIDGPTTWSVKGTAPVSCK